MRSRGRGSASRAISSASDTRCRLGDGSLTRGHAQAGRDHCRCSPAEMGCSMPRASTTTRFATRSSWCRSPTIEDAWSEVPEEHHRADRQGSPRQTRRGRTAAARIRAVSLMVRESTSGTITDYQYTSVRVTRCRWSARSLTASQGEQIDAIVYPTASRRRSALTRRPIRLVAPPPMEQSREPVGFSDLIVRLGSARRICRSAFRSSTGVQRITFAAIGYAFEQRRARAACPCTLRCAPAKSIAVQ